MTDDDSSLKIAAYKDIGSPAAKEAGDVLRRTVRLALAPVRATLWTLEEAESFLTEKIAQRFSGLQSEEVVSPPARIYGPILTGVATVGDEQLRLMYAELLASSMTKETSSSALPVFADIIRQMTPSEARIVKLVGKGIIPGGIPTLRVSKSGGTGPNGIWARHVSTVGLEAGVESPDMTSVYLENLERLGLIRDLYPLGSFSEDRYSQVRSLKDLSLLAAYAKKISGKLSVEKSGYVLTELGARFVDCCLEEMICVPYDIEPRLDERVVGYVNLLERLHGPLNP